MENEIDVYQKEGNASHRKVKYIITKLTTINSYLS